MNLGGNTTQAKSPSRLGSYLIAALVIVLLIFVVKGLNYTEVVQAKVEEPTRNRTGSDMPVGPPPVEKIQEKPAPQQPAPQQPRAQPTKPPQKSDAQKEREKQHLLAQYDSPLVPLGERGGRRSASLDDGDMPRESMPGRQVVDVPSRYGSGGRGGHGDVWRNDFYARGEGQVGVLQQPTSPFEIHPGAVIPARLIRSINTDTPGQVTGEVTRDVFDSVTGRHLLIPFGSKIVGGYDTRIGYGQERLPTAWDWLILPNGARMPLGAMPGADQSGVAGIPIDVDNHMWSTAGRALLLTVTGAAADVAMHTGMGSGGDLAFDDAFRREGGRNLDRQSQEIWRRGGNRPPTGTAESGDIFLVQVMAPMIFPGPYEDQTLEGFDDELAE